MKYPTHRYTLVHGWSLGLVNIFLGNWLEFSGPWAALDRCDILPIIWIPPFCIYPRFAALTARSDYLTEFVVRFGQLTWLTEIDMGNNAVGVWRKWGNRKQLSPPLENFPPTSTTTTQRPLKKCAAHRILIGKNLPNWSLINKKRRRQEEMQILCRTVQKLVSHPLAL